MAMGELDAAATDFQAVIDGAVEKEMAGYDQQLEARLLQPRRRRRSSKATRRKPPITSPVPSLINRTDADALYLLGKALIESGDPKSGIDALHLAIALVPTGWCDPYAELANAYTAQKDATGATYASGMVALCEQRFTEAKTQLTTASSGKYALDAFIGLGLLAEEQGDYIAAADAYGKALAMEPQSFAATTGMGRVGGASQVHASPSPSASGGN